MMIREVRRGAGLGPGGRPPRGRKVRMRAGKPSGGGGWTWFWLFLLLILAAALVASWAGRQ